MARARGAVLVRDRTALEQLRRAQEPKEQAAKVEGEVMHRLGPLKDHLRELVLERDRLLYDAIAARQNFFTAAKKAYPQLEERPGLRRGTPGGAPPRQGPHPLGRPRPALLGRGERRAAPASRLHAPPARPPPLGPALLARLAFSARCRS